MCSVVMRHYWGYPSGGALLSAAAAHALDSAGMEPAISGTFKFDPSKYREWYGMDISGYRVYTFGISLHAFGLLAVPFAYVPARRAIEDTGAKLLFTDIGVYMPLKRSFRDLRVIEYVHFPHEAFLDPRYRDLGFYYKDQPGVMGRYGRFPMNVYWRAYVKLFYRYSRRNPFESADAVLTNSKWTAEVARRVYGERPEPLPAPLPPSVRIVESPPPFEEREPAVVMLGRFSDDKRYHWAVGDVWPRLRGLGAKLVIFGGVGPRREYLGRVRAEAVRAGLRAIAFPDGARIPARDVLGADADVVLLPNAPRELIDGVMGRSRAFLHATVNEHFGMAVAEAMAKGLPIVVHRSGGAWTDLAEEGRKGLGYETAEEAAEALSKLLTDPRLSNELASRGIERAKEMTLERFDAILGELASRVRDST